MPERERNPRKVEQRYPGTKMSERERVQKRKERVVERSMSRETAAV